MSRAWTMPGANGALLVVRRGDGCRRGLPGPGPCSETVLRSWLADPTSRTAALEMFELATGVPAGAVGVAEPDLRRRVVDELGRAFRDARLTADVSPQTRALRPFEAWGPGRRNGDPRGAAARATPAIDDEPPRRRLSEPDPKKTWIEIVLLDDDGKPVADERCRLKLPDGSVRVHTLDARGRLRVDGIDPGTCEVTFPDRDGRDWRPEA